MVRLLHLLLLLSSSACLEFCCCHGDGRLVLLLVDDYLFLLLARWHSPKWQREIWEYALNFRAHLPTVRVTAEFGDDDQDEVNCVCSRGALDDQSRAYGVFAEMSAFSCVAELKTRLTGEEEKSQSATQRESHNKMVVVVDKKKDDGGSRGRNRPAMLQLRSSKFQLPPFFPFTRSCLYLLNYS